MSHLISLFLSVAGFGCLCLAMPRHQKVLMGKALQARTTRFLRPIGFALLGLALLRAAAGLGWAYGAISWVAHLSLAAWLVITFLAWRSRRTA